MSELLLGGLDGSNPLGFLAALGVLNVLADRAGGDPGPRLAWRDGGSWRPVVITAGEWTRLSLVRAVAEDLAAWKQEPALALEYGDGERDLKPPPEEFRAFLERLVGAASLANRRSIDLASAFATDVAVDSNGNTKPTALHFTAGKQKFLAQVLGLAEGVEDADLAEALFGPWSYSRPLPVLKWDATTTRDYALRAGDPSKEKVLGVPGADWLAFRGLSFIQVVPRGHHVATTGCFGGWNEGDFRWPLWSVPLSREVVRSVLRLDAASLSEAHRRARGICAVLESRIRRSDQGGYGSFSPAAIV